MTRIIPIQLFKTTAYIIEGESGYICVDGGMKMTTDDFGKLFQDHNINPKEVRLIALTHAHPDHYLSLNALKEITGAPLLCHKMALHTLESGKIAMSYPRNEMGEKFLTGIRQKTMPTHIPIEADIVVEDFFDLKKFGFDAEILHTPGHSDCSISLLLSETGDVFIGDLLVTSYSGRIEAAILATNENQLFESIRKLSLRASCFYSAHGGPYTKDEVLELLERESHLVSISQCVE